MDSKDNENLESIDFNDLMNGIPDDFADELSGEMQTFSVDANTQNDMINKLAFSEGVMDNGNQLDNLLASALEQELSSAAGNMGLGTVDPEFIGDISVYDTEERESIDFLPAEFIPGEELEEIAKPPSNSGSGKFTPIFFKMAPFVIIGILVILIAIFGFTLVTLLRRLPARQTTAADNGLEVPLFSKPGSVYNNQNFIFLGLEETFAGEPIKLEKMIIDQGATVFYFDKPLNIYNTTFSLTDNAGKLYNLDLSFSRDDLTSSSGSSVRFEPLTGRGTSFTLLVQDRVSDEIATFKFDLENGFDFTPASFINAPIKFEDLPDGIEITAENAMFSSSGSTVNFTVKWTGHERSIEIKPEVDGVPSITLDSPLRSVLPARRSPVLYQFPEYNLTLGRMDFAPVEKLTDRMSLSFNGLYETIELDETIPTDELFKNDGSKPIEDEIWVRLPVAGYTVVLERMGRESNIFVLVMHVLDKNGEVVESKPGIALSLTIQSGFEISLDARVLSTPLGTDVLFNEPIEFVSLTRALTPSSIVLKLSSLALKLNSISNEINLATADSRLSEEADEAKTSVIDSFIERLRYKSSIIPISQIYGFGDNVLEDELLMRNYTPEPIAQTTTSLYSAQIISYALIGNDTLLCAVNESWQIEQASGNIQFNRTHKIVAKKSVNGWIIVSDELVQ